MKKNTDNIQKLENKLSELPITEITPEGWLFSYLSAQKNGLTGNIDKAGYPFNGAGWTGFAEKEPYDHWAQYEQIGYWIDGALRCGYLLSNMELINKTKVHIDYVLGHPDRDGFLGPRLLKSLYQLNLWPHVVFFRALIAEYKVNNNPEIINKLIKHYQSKEINSRSLRELCNIEIILFLYGESSNAEMLEIALKKYREYEELYFQKNLVNEQDLNYYDMTEKNLFSIKENCRR